MTVINIFQSIPSNYLKDLTANISHEIVPSEERAKHCFKNEWTLEVTFSYFTGKYPTLVSEV